MPRANRVTFRLPASALFVPVMLLFLITPLATAGPWWGLFFAVPVGALAWVLITRTTATSTGVTAHGLFGSRTMAWSQMDGLEFRGSRWAIAVGQDGRQLRLPMVRPRDLPRLAAVSGGSLNLAPPTAAGPAGEADPAAEVGPQVAQAAAENAATADPVPDADPAEPVGDDAVGTGPEQADRAVR